MRNYNIKILCLLIEGIVFLLYKWYAKHLVIPHFLTEEDEYRRYGIVIRLLKLQRRATAVAPYFQPQLEVELVRVPEELFTTYHFLAENDERGRYGSFIRLLWLQRRAISIAHYFQRRLESELVGVPTELLTTYRFLTENDERGRNRIFIRLQRRATAVAPYLQRALAFVCSK